MCEPLLLPIVPCETDPVVVGPCEVPPPCEGPPPDLLPPDGRAPPPPLGADLFPAAALPAPPNTRSPVRIITAEPLRIILRRSFVVIRSSFPFLWSGAPSTKRQPVIRTLLIKMRAERIADSLRAPGVFSVTAYKPPFRLCSQPVCCRFLADLRPLVRHTRGAP